MAYWTFLHVPKFFEPTLISQTGPENLSQSNLSIHKNSEQQEISMFDMDSQVNFMEYQHSRWDRMGEGIGQPLMTALSR